MQNTKTNQERKRLIVRICELTGLKISDFDDWSDEQLTLFFGDLVGRVRK
jgi:hypothetical protein